MKKRMIVGVLGLALASSVAMARVVDVKLAQGQVAVDVMVTEMLQGETALAKPGRTEMKAEAQARLATKSQIEVAKTVKTVKTILTRNADAAIWMARAIAKDKGVTENEAAALVNLNSIVDAAERQNVSANVMGLLRELRDLSDAAMTVEAALGDVVLGQETMFDLANAISEESLGIDRATKIIAQMAEAMTKVGARVNQSATDGGAKMFKQELEAAAAAEALAYYTANCEA